MRNQIVFTTFLLSTCCVFGGNGFGQESKKPFTKLPLLDQARNHAAEFMDDLPNFVVTQIVTRSVRTAKRKEWQQQDKLEIEVRYRAKAGGQSKQVRYKYKPRKLT